MQIDNAEWGLLMARMMENGMVELRQRSTLERWQDKVVTAGLFGVPKSDDKMRLIVGRQW